MHSFDDDMELDQITRSAANAFQAPTGANWEKMQRVLDKELPQQKKRRGGLIWWIAPSILALGLGFIWLQSNQKQLVTKAPIQKESIQPKPIQNSIVTQTKKEPVAINLKEDIVFEISSASLNSKKIKNMLPDLLSNPATLNNTNTVNESHKESAITQADLPSNNTINPNNSSNTVNDSNPEQNKSVSLVTSNKSVQVHNKKGFFISIIGGFDASTVKYNYVSNVGYNIGGTLGYRFNNHWSLQSGAIFTQKNYKLKGADFHAPKGSWISYYDIETVDGYCKMWDVPLIATYHFNGNSNGNSFISIGSSSYFMKNENYNYLYYYNSQPYSRSSNYNSTDQHLFALLHISAGIERPLSKNITTIIEPYAKIPLSGVGFGGIQLSSFGLNFSVQYRQPKN
ncbi:MAG: outer membrane beta-barrel protein [Bacteroidota bacterium]